MSTTRYFEVNCRDAPAGGGIVGWDPRTVGTGLRGARHLIVLIHGFNVTLDEARAVYAEFMNNQAAYVDPPGRDWAFGATVVGVFWPGDGTWGLLRPLYYPQALPLADKTAGFLGEILLDLRHYCGEGVTVDLVGHSMGNRVALRLLSLVANASGITIRRVLHMAAAVPTWRLEKDGDEFRNGLLRETRGERVTSLYSSRDDVLAFAFPVGETLREGEEGVLPTALGHEQWAHGAGLIEQIAESLGHGEYWNKLDPKVPHDALALWPAAPLSPASHAIACAIEVEPRTLDGRSINARAIGDNVDGSRAA